MNVKQFLASRSVGLYLALTFSVLSILLTIVLVRIIGVTASEQVRLNIGQGLSELALQTADRLDRGMFERYREVQLIAQRPDIRGKGNAVIKREILESLQKTYPYYAWIGMADSRGRVQVSTQKMLEGADVAKRPWFVNALNGVYLGDVHEAVLLAKLLPSADGEPLRFVDVAFPYVDQQGRTSGVLGAHLSWQWAKDLAKSIIQPSAEHRRVESLIVGADGAVLLGPAALLGTKLTQKSFAEAQNRARGFQIEDWPDGQQYLVGYSKSKGYSSYPGLGWTVLVRQNIDDAFLPVKRIQQQVLVSGIAIAALFSFLGLLAARRITQPLVQLAESAKRIQHGAAVEIVPRGASYAEVEALSGTLNALVGNLLQKEAALRELNLTLEKRVERRTDELRQALAVVSAGQNRIQTILETAQDAFIGVNLQGVITDWNSQAERMFGWTRQEAIGQPLVELVVPQRFRDSYAQAIRAFSQTGKTGLTGRRIERVVMNRSEKEFIVEMTLGLAGDGDNSFFSTFLHDISERKKVEQMKNEFVSVVSHELRTPLTSIRMSLGLLADGTAGDLPADARSLLGIASEGCERLVRLINDLLDIEKIESGNMQLAMRRQALLPLVEGAIAAMRGYALQYDIRIELVRPAASTEVVVDHDRMTQVAINLLSNAIKFSPTGAQVTVKLARHGQYVRLTVSDVGSGIPVAFRDRIFERFAQADSTDSRQIGGTGLGLSISKSIVDDHGGVISFDSVIGQGTSFHVDLPAADAAPAIG